MILREIDSYSAVSNKTNKNRILMLMFMTASICVLSAGVVAAEDISGLFEGDFKGLTFTTAVSGPDVGQEYSNEIFVQDPVHSILNKNSEEIEDNEILILENGYRIRIKDVNKKVYPNEIWLVLEKNSIELDDKIIVSGERYSWNNNDDHITLNAELFVGTIRDVVFFTDIYQISDGNTVIDNEEFTIICSSGIRVSPDMNSADNNIKGLVALNSNMLQSSSFPPATGYSQELLKENYRITLLEVDVDGNEAWMRLSKNGDKIDDKVVKVGGSYNYVDGSYDNLLLSFKLEKVFAGISNDYIEISNIYQYSETDSSVIVQNESALLIAGSTGRFILTGGGLKWQLEENYALHAIDIDVNGQSRELMLLLTKDSTHVDYSIINVSDSYTYYKNGNLIITADLETVFSGENGISLARLYHVYQNSEDTGEILLSDAVHLYLAGDTSGVQWQLDQNYSLSAMDIDSKDIPRQVWFRLKKDGNTLEDKFVHSGNSTVLYDNNTKILELKVRTIFNGKEADLVFISDVYQYSENFENDILIENGTHLFIFGSTTGNDMQLYENYTLSFMDIDIRSDPSQVWLRMKKNGIPVDDKVIAQNEEYRFYNNNALLFEGYVMSAFSGRYLDMLILTNANQYSEIDDTLLITDEVCSFYPENLEQLMDLNNKQALAENYLIVPIDILGLHYPESNYYHGDQSLWLRLYKDDTMVDEVILFEGQNYSYYNGNMKIISTKLAAIFMGMNVDLVKFEDLYQYSEADGSMIKYYDGLLLWLGRLIPPGPPSITSFDPSAIHISDVEGATRKFTIHVNQSVDVNWYLNGTVIQFNESVSNAEYTNTSASAGTWVISAIANNPNGTVSHNWTWTVLTDSELPVHNTNTGENFLTIQSAIDDSDTLNGHTIIVDNKTYFENVVLNKSLRLAGNGFPTIDATGSGDAINITTDNCIVQGFKIVNADISGIYLLNSSNSFIYNNICENNVAGIFSFNSSNNKINDNICNDSGIGIILINSHNSIISNNICFNNTKTGVEINGDIFIGFEGLSNNNIVKNNTCGNSSIGIGIVGSNNTVSYNSCSYSIYGIGIFAYHNNSITYNVCENNSIGIGVGLEDFSNNTIAANNDVSNNSYGILAISSNITLVQNNVLKNIYGIYFWGLNSSIIDNNISNNSFVGFYLEYSLNNTITQNTFVNDGLIVGSFSKDNFNNNIIVNNTVNGNPLIYLEDVSDQNLDQTATFAGQIILVNCENITVKGFDMLNTSIGIELYGTNNSKIIDNVVLNNFEGIHLSYANNNVIIDNNVSGNKCGIEISQSSNNNIVYHNNLIDNEIQALNYYGSINTWDNGYPSGGNYWSDYSGTDNNNDGIGDTSYNISGITGVQDRYPLMQPWEGVDFTPPYITSTYPANLATNVEINYNNTATFSEPMDSSTLNNSTIKMFIQEQIAGETFEDTTGKWNSTNFQGFIHTEQLMILPQPIDDSNRTIGVGNIIYSTQPTLRDYHVYSNEGIEVEGSGNYSVVGWMGDEYVVIDNVSDWMISELVFEQDPTDTKTLHVEETWDLGDGYFFKLIELDVEGEEAWVALSNSNGIIDEQVCQNQSACTFSVDLGASSSTPFIITYLNEVNSTQSHLELKYTWLISLNTMTIQNGQPFGYFDAHTMFDKIILENDEDILLSKGNTIPLFNDFNFKVEDTPTVRYRLVHQTGTPVTGDIYYDIASRTVTFDPVSDLMFDTNYISYITTGAEDLVGNGLMEDHVWTFQTASYEAGDIPQITDFKVEPNTSVSINNPAIASAYITDEYLNSVYFELFDSNGLINTNNIMLWWYQNESGINGVYSPPPWHANVWSITNDTMQDVVTMRYPADCPDNGILYGNFRKNNTADVEEALLWFNLTTGNLTNITLDDIDRTPLSIETGVSIFSIFNFKLAFIPLIEGPTFTLYNIGEPNNPHILSIPVPTGTYKVLAMANDTAGIAKVLWADIEVDNTPPNITITSPANNSTVYTPDITVFGNTTDNIGIIDISYTHDCTIEWPESGESGGESGIGSPPYPTIIPINQPVTLCEGWNLLTFYCTDVAGNTANISIDVIVEPQYKNLSVNTTANNVTVLDDALEKVDTIIELVTLNNTTGGTVSMMVSNATPMKVNQTFGMDALGKYVYINISDSLNDNISWAVIKIFYTQSELKTSGLDEKSLVLRHYNETSGAWESLTSTGVNTTDDGNYSGYVWANVSHFSYYGIAEEIKKEDSRDGNGGGGGGGGASGEDFYNILLSETDRQKIFKNSDVSFNFDQEGNIVSHINFTSIKSAGTVAAKVEILSNTSTLVSTPPPNKVYKNLNIWVGNAGWATKRNIEDITVVFTVDRPWITKNNIDESSIALYRYSGGAWQELVTTKTSEGVNSLQFEAETPGFSPFAVTGKTTVEPGGEGIISEPEVTEVTAVETSEPMPAKKKGLPGFGLFAGLSVLLIAVQSLRKRR